ncbi:MAG: carbohydrate-binding family 9-like protein [Bacteroidaceae bacterium]|nr:carbohydrate-binding family 9-like protein [Bacteroidaceae bacterium]
MKKFAFICLSAACLLPLISSGCADASKKGNNESVAGEQGVYEKYERYLTDPRSYICYRTEGKLKIDGKLDEPSWQKAPSTEEFEDISGEGFATPKYKTTAKMLWDDDYLYVGAVLEEPNIVANLTQRDTIIYYDNDFEVFIDPDNDAHNYFEIEVNARNVLFDLILEKPYRVGGDFLLQWDCPGIQSAIYIDGTLNNPKDEDKFWSVEMAIPRQALTLSFNNLLKAGNTWRINFSRVEWLKKPEENWVWTATGRIDMHMPERWGYMLLSDKVVGTQADEMKYPHDTNVYKTMWAVFYAQQDSFNESKAYKTLEELGLDNAGVTFEATSHSYQIRAEVPSEGVVYVLDNEGHFWKEKK